MYVNRSAGPTVVEVLHCHENNTEKVILTPTTPHSTVNISLYIYVIQWVIGSCVEWQCGLSKRHFGKCILYLRCVCMSIRHYVVDYFLY